MDRRAFNKTVGVIGAGMLSGLGPGRLDPSVVIPKAGVATPMNQAFDVERARRETPGCARVMHLNNAGSSLPPQTVLDAVVGHLQLEAEIGGLLSG